MKPPNVCDNAASVELIRYYHLAGVMFLFQYNPRTGAARATRNLVQVKSVTGI